MKNRIIEFVTFFSFAGFYLGIELLLSINMAEYTRYYAIPIRLMLCGFMVFYILFYSKLNVVKNHKRIPYEAFLYLFWIIYIFKALYYMLDPSIYFGKGKSEYIFYTIAFCVLPFSFYSRVNLDKFGSRIVDILILAGGCLGILSFYLYFDIIISGRIARLNQAHYMGFEVGTINPLMLAYAGATTVGLVMFRMLYYSSLSLIRNIYYGTTLCFSGIMLLLGASRGSLVALLVTFFIFYIFGNTNIRKKFIVIFVVSAPLLVWGAVKVGSSLFNRTATTIDQSVTENSRFEYWEQAIEEFVISPILGGRIEVGGIYPHNFVIEILMATGFIGFLCFVIPFIKAVQKGISLAKKNNNYVWLLVLLAQGFVHYSFSEGLYYAIQLFIPMGMIYSTMKGDERQAI